MNNEVWKKFIYIRFIHFFGKQKIISNKQYEFRKGVSTKNISASIIDCIYNKLDKSQHVITTFLDLANTVNHEILLSKLEMNGIRGIALNLIKSSLENRTRIVKIENVKSNTT